jgi:hypothetical protein
MCQEFEQVKRTLRDVWADLAPLRHTRVAVIQFTSRWKVDDITGLAIDDESTVVYSQFGDASATCGSTCGQRRVLTAVHESECPAGVIAGNITLPSCRSCSLGYGDMCQSDGSTELECGTDQLLNNCNISDVYLIGQEGSVDSQDQVRTSASFASTLLPALPSQYSLASTLSILLRWLRVCSYSFPPPSFSSHLPHFPTLSPSCLSLPTACASLVFICLSAPSSYFYLQFEEVLRVIDSMNCTTQNESYTRPANLLLPFAQAVALLQRPPNSTASTASSKAVGEQDEVQGRAIFLLTDASMGEGVAPFTPGDTVHPVMLPSLPW